jgi:hypothetical protein
LPGSQGFDFNFVPEQEVNLDRGQWLNNKHLGSQQINAQRVGVLNTLPDAFFFNGLVQFGIVY